MLRRADQVLAAVHEEDRRGARRNTQALGELVLLLRLEIPRVREDREVRPATDFVDVVLRLIGSLLEARRRGDREMAARGEADHADALGIDAPVARLAADEADRALGVLKRPARWDTLGL